MRVKVLMKWNIREDNEAEYNDFLVNDFIPRLERLGINEIQFWYTTFGECEQIHASGTTSTREKMSTILGSDSWHELHTQLEDHISDFQLKVVRAGGEIQI